jgi:heptaprenyl diphosphate synthase
MTTTSYLDLHRRMAAGIAAERRAALDTLGASAPSVRAAVARFLERRTFRYPLSVLPLIVHAVETGDPRPALPLTVVHDLWWASACWLDDLADAHGDHGRGRPDDDGDALLATVVAAAPLPLLVLRSDRIPEPVRGALSTEVVTCWIKATEGQLRDLHAEPTTATRDSVTAAYLGKSGAPFSMITAMAARLAGAAEPRVGRWRRFGEVFGILWQLLNDQEDIDSGRHEDLLNGTPTYLLACAVETGAPAAVRRITALHAAARTSAAARADLTDLLLGPEVLAVYEKDVGAFRDQARHLLDELPGDTAHLAVMRDLVDRSSRMLLRPRTTTPSTL